MSSVNKQFDRASIEAIVRQVLQRITSAANFGSAPTFGSPQVQSPTSFQNQTSSEDLHSCFNCTNKVVSTETLRGKLNNIKTLRVKPKTIVTPAARDELRDRNITIVFDLGADNPNSNGPATILLGTTCVSTGNRVRDQLVNGGTQVQLQIDNCVNQLATKIGNQISPAISALIVTDEPYKAACTANRNANVRAVVINETNELTAAKAELNPNCVVLKKSNVGRLNLTTILNQLT